MDHIYNYLSKNLIYKERLQKKEKKKKKGWIRGNNLVIFLHAM